VNRGDEDPSSCAQARSDPAGPRRAESLFLLVALDLGQLLTWESEEVILRGVKAAHIHRHRLPPLLATFAVDVSRGAATLAVLGYANREHALIEQVDLLHECTLRRLSGPL
jgi:hypothetical protein